MNAQQKRRLQTITLRSELQQERESVVRLRQGLDLASKRDADRLTAIAKNEETIQLLRTKTVDLVSERDRLIRMVDQFTSVSINVLGNTPKELRKT